MHLKGASVRRQSGRLTSQSVGEGRERKDAARSSGFLDSAGNQLESGEALDVELPQTSLCVSQST